MGMARSANAEWQGQDITLSEKRAQSSVPLCNLFG